MSTGLRAIEIRNVPIERRRESRRPREYAYAVKTCQSTLYILAVRTAQRRRDLGGGGRLAER